MRNSLGMKQETEKFSQSSTPSIRYANSFVLSLLNEILKKGTKQIERIKPVSIPVIVICLRIHRSSMCAFAVTRFYKNDLQIRLHPQVSYRYDI